MPIKPKNDIIDKKISNIIDRRIDKFDIKHHKRWVKVAELSIGINDMLQHLSSRLNTYLPYQETMDRQVENEVNKIKGEINNLKDISGILRNICTSTVGQLPPAARPPPPPPPPPPKIPTTRKKISPSKKDSPNKALSRKPSTTGVVFKGIHNAAEIKRKANAMQSARLKNNAIFKLENKMQDVENKARNLQRMLK
jgi:hypothetical protein